MHLVPAAGPRPAPLPASVRLLALAWTQLAALVLAAAWGAAGVAFLMSDAYKGLACFDRARPACEPNLGASFAAYYAGLQVLVLAAALAAVVIARRHRRGAAGRTAAVTTLVGAFAVAVVIDGSFLV